jgi:hypothetical protein
VSGERIDWWSLSDEELFAQCAFDRYRASGPGGQKRNKTDSAVRLRHGPTGLIVTAADSRSQHDNRARALKRLRAALAFELRQATAGATPPEAILQAMTTGQLALKERDANFLPAYAWVLDVMEEQQGRLAETAERLGVSTGRLVRFLETSPDGWQAAMRLRAKYGQKPLRAGE